MITTARNSCQWVALRLLNYLGIPDFAPAPTSTTPDQGRLYLTEGMLDEIAGVMTAAMQDIFEDGPASLSQSDYGRALHAPATVTLHATQGSNVVTLAAGFQDWMNGCAVRIPGDGWLNEWADNTGLLRRPYLGPTANGLQAIVLCNAIELEEDIRSVLEPVRVAGCAALTPCGSREEYDELSGCHALSGGARQGAPSHYFVENRYDETLDYRQTFLRVAPVPAGPLPITFAVRLNPAVIAVEDLGDNDADPGTLPSLPGRWVESIFLPYCLQRWTGSALFKNESVRGEIARQYQEARRRLAGFRAQTSSRGGAVAFRP